MKTSRLSQPYKIQAHFYRVLVTQLIVMSAPVQLSWKPPELGDRTEYISACSVRRLHPTRGGGKGGGGGSSVWPFLQHAPPPRSTSSIFFPLPPFPLLFFQSYRAVKTMSYNSGRRIIPRSRLRDWNPQPLSFGHMALSILLTMAETVTLRLCLPGMPP